jgi:hypothetical protein
MTRPQLATGVYAQGRLPLASVGGPTCSTPLVSATSKRQRTSISKQAERDSSSEFDIGDEEVAASVSSGMICLHNVVP